MSSDTFADVLLTTTRVAVFSAPRLAYYTALYMTVLFLFTLRPTLPLIATIYQRRICYLVVARLTSNRQSGY